jgi:hypothetical protein
MAELADAHGSGPCESNFMQVQVLLSAPSEYLGTQIAYRGFFFFYIKTPVFEFNIFKFFRPDFIGLLSFSTFCQYVSFALKALLLAFLHFC